jgi:hypothetical protein
MEADGSGDLLSKVLLDMTTPIRQVKSETELEALVKDKTKQAQNGEGVFFLGRVRLTKERHVEEYRVVRSAVKSIKAQTIGLSDPIIAFVDDSALSSVQDSPGRKEIMLVKIKKSAGFSRGCFAQHSIAQLQQIFQCNGACLPPLACMHSSRASDGHLPQGQATADPQFRRGPDR